MNNVNVKGFIVTEENFHAAFNAAPYWARVRLVKKMNKQIHSPKKFALHMKSEPSQLTGKPLLVVDRTRPFGLMSEPRMPADIEQYVENFVFTYGGK